MSLLFHMLLKLFSLLLWFYLHLSQLLLTFYALFSLLLLLFLKVFYKVLSLFCSFTLYTKILKVQTACDHGSSSAGGTNRKGFRLFWYRWKFLMLKLSFYKLISKLLDFVRKLIFLDLNKFRGTGRVIDQQTLFMLRNNQIFLL